jgi:phosphate starvation-inducible protein PhoH
MRIIDKMKSFQFIEFDENDIVRSAMVKEYIISKHRLGIAA